MGKDLSLMQRGGWAGNHVSLRNFLRLISSVYSPSFNECFNSER